MHVIRRRVTFANVTSLLALFVALSGVAYAALPAGSVGTAQLKTGAVTTAKIATNAVTGTKIASNTVTGSDVNEATLGQVPSALIAATANNALSADSADSATTALTASSANNHHPISGLLAADGNGVDEDSARTDASAVTLLDSPPFSVTAKCFTDTVAHITYGEVYLGTSQDGVVFNARQDGENGNPNYLNDDTIEVNRQLDYNSATQNSSSYGINFDGFMAFAPGGSTIFGQISVSVKNGTLADDGAWGAGDACVVIADISVPAPGPT